MNSTALGAENKKKQTINFISEAHEKFYYEKLKEVQSRGVEDVKQKAVHMEALKVREDKIR